MYVCVCMFFELYSSYRIVGSAVVVKVFFSFRCLIILIALNKMYAKKKRNEQSAPSYFAKDFKNT